MSTSQRRPHLGQWCVLKATAKKSRQGTRTRWYTYPHSQPVRAMFVGWRTVHDVDAEYDVDVTEFGETFPVGWIITHQGSHEVWLFVISGRHNPIRAFPADVQPEGVNYGQ